jgi:hypothetical protein
MPNELRIVTPGGVQVTFHSRRIDADGWVNSYAVELAASDLRASTVVENPGYGHPPSQLLSELAANWRGWKGVNSWSAVEGELKIDASCDSLGHVTLLFTIPAYASQKEWSAAASVVCEAGQLEAVAREASAFFAGSDA